MMVTGGSTDVTTYFKLRLTATGLEATGLTIADLDLQYVRSGVAPVAKVDAVALAATDTAHTDNRAIEIDATDQPGVYRVDWPDAAFAAGVKEVILTVKHASCFSEDLRVLIDAPVNITKVSGDAQAADLLELFAEILDPTTGQLDSGSFVDGTLTPAAHEGIAQGGSATTITLDAGASSVNDFYRGQVAYLVSGTGARQNRVIRSYNGTTKAATVTPAWATDPVNGTGFKILPSSPAGELILADYTVAGSLGKVLGDNINATISSRSSHSAADVWAVGTRVLTAGTNIQLPSNGLANVTAWTVNITGNLSGSVGSVTAAVTAGTVSDKTGYSLAATGLNLVVPADPSAIPVLGTASIVTWIGWFGAWTVNEVNVTSSSAKLRNSADNADMASHAISDDGTTFSSQEPT